jgi:heat shock protein HspQ
MLPTFEAKLKGNQLEWIDEIPEQTKNHQSISVYVTFREEEPAKESDTLQKQRIVTETEDERRQRGQQMAKILQKIADTGGTNIDDPVAWQRETRRDRPLPGREE